MNLNEEEIEVPLEPKEDLPYEDSEMKVEDESDEEVALTIDEDSPNLVDDLQTTPAGEEFLKKLVKDVCDEVTTSWDKNADYREKVAQSWRLLYCDLPPKQKPFEHCANAAIPLALQNIVRYTNKITSELFGDWSNVFNFVPTNAKAETIAPIVTEHSNWQIRNKIVGFKRQQHRGILIFAVAGDVVCHSYWDPVTKSNCHEILTCDDFVCPYTHVSVAPDFSDCPWVARRIPMFKSKLRSMKREWANVDKVLGYTPPEHGQGELETNLRDQIADHLGEDPFGQKAGEYEIIHYEGWLELPGQDQERYCQLIFDKCSLIPLKLTVHEKESYNERYRYQYQMNQFQVYQEELNNYMMMLQGKQQQIQMLASTALSLPQDSPDVGGIMQQLDMLQQQPDPPPPNKPTWMKEDGQPPAPPAKSPIYMFSHGVCLEPMLGNLGIGIGRIDAQLNLAANTVWSQFLDAATLGNGKTFITAGNVDFRSPFKIGPGVFNKAKNVMPSDLQNAFYELDFGQANPQLLQAAGQLMQFGEQASSTPDLMSGAPGKSGETARGIQARLEQINAMIAIPAQKYADFVIQIAKNNCKINAVYMQEHEVFYCNRFNDDMLMQGPGMLNVAREFYDNEFEVELVADLQFKSRSQKIAEADEIVQLPNALPELQMNIPLKYHAVKEALKARGLHKFARVLLGPAPPPPFTTFGLPPNTPGTSTLGPDGQPIPAPPPMPPMPGQMPGGPQGDPNQGAAPPGPPQGAPQ